MNTKALKQAAAEFLREYPGGFNHPVMVEVGKKHKKDKITNLARDLFAKKHFRDSSQIIDSMAKIVSQSTLISMFEKPKFRDMTRALSPGEKDVLAGGLKSLLHGSEKRGFEIILGIVVEKKLARWPLMTAFQYYYRPDEEVFIKPTTTKLIIKKLELDLVYRPQPSWAFYEAYRSAVNKMKQTVPKSLSPSNAAFCGFLMMTFDKEMRPNR